VTAPPLHALYIPAPGSVLTGPEVTFTWSAASGASGYSLWIGSTGVGSYNLHDSGEHQVTSVKIGGLPTNGETLYVRLNTTSGRTTVHTDYTYTATTQATLISPSPSTTLAGSTVTFTWSVANGSDGYSLWIGSTGPGSDNVYVSHLTAETSATAKGLPSNGETLYARLFTKWANVMVYSDFIYTAP
jgi:hypothetical protein